MAPPSLLWAGVPALYLCSYHITAPVLGIQNLHHLQCKVNLICVWMRSPRSTRPHPRGTAVVMVTMPITVTKRESASKGRANGCEWHRWLFQSLAQHSLLSSLFLWQQSSPVSCTSPVSRDLFELTGGFLFNSKNKKWIRPDLHLV